MTTHTTNSPPPELAEAEDGVSARMSLLEHLGELRRRLFRALLGVIVGTTIGVFFAAEVLDFLIQPYCGIEKVAERVSESEPCRFLVLGPTGGIVSYFRVSLLVGASLAIPILTYQLLMFVLPGLKRREKRWLLSSLPAVTALFVVGVAFSWYVLIPPALGFLGGFQPTIFKPEWTADLYLSFVTTLLFWMGAAFQTPLVFFILALLGLVQARTLVRNWRLAIVGAAFAAAIITPTIDPVNMLLVMGPLLVLYALSVLLVVVGARLNGVNR
ncbi:MAG: twin-arginine translocase subunit TatC [Anaerolineaceae bacterium]|nr:twin-arginine translocase subunit TatC [Anaerolineaceae bacterium]MCY3936275.1 twin-arginine translocase subunit TatC [Chloroflexota bacterium]MCY4107206.1 twin-arginine translocase subunit TatC [Chloroflexota bacterium]